MILTAICSSCLMVSLRLPGPVSWSYPIVPLLALTAWSLEVLQASEENLRPRNFQAPVKDPVVSDRLSKNLCRLVSSNPLARCSILPIIHRARSIPCLLISLTSTALPPSPTPRMPPSPLSHPRTPSLAQASDTDFPSHPSSSIWRLLPQRSDPNLRARCDQPTRTIGWVVGALRSRRCR